MQTHYPKILVSILNYNGIEKTIATIECIKRQTCPNVDLILIDSASTNNCMQKIKNQFPELRTIRLSKNSGYTGGNNVALEIGLDKGYDYVIISNHDIELEEQVLEKMVETAEQLPDAGVVGAIEEDFFTGEIRAVGGDYFDYRVARGKWLTSIQKTKKETLEVKYVQGAFFLFSRAAIESGIRFDERLFMYCEEIDLYFQLKEKRLKAYVDLRCRIQHKSVEKRFLPYQGYFMQRNRIYLCKKYISLPWYLIPLFYILLIELPIKVIVRTYQGQAHYAKVCIQGFFDGIWGNMYIGKGFHSKQ